MQNDFVPTFTNLNFIKRLSRI